MNEYTFFLTSENKHAALPLLIVNICANILSAQGANHVCKVNHTMDKNKC